MEPCFFNFPSFKIHLWTHTCSKSTMQSLEQLVELYLLESNVVLLTFFLTQNEFGTIFTVSVAVFNMLLYSLSLRKRY